MRSIIAFNFGLYV